MSANPALVRIGYARMFAAACGALALLAAVLVADGLYHPSRFPIDRIEVRGKLQQVNGEDIKRAVEGALRGNFFSVNLPHLESEIEALPWVFRAPLRRRWPSTLLVQVTEVRPVALWGDAEWLHVTGDLVARENRVQAGRVQTGDLPRLDGPAGQHARVWQSFQTWSALLAEHELRLHALQLDRRGLWRLQISRAHSPARVLVTLDEINARAKLRRFARAFERKLAVQFADMQSVDLRYPNGFAVGWREH